MWRRYLTLFGRNIPRDLEEELEFHIEARSRELMDAGWLPQAAEEEARRLFGDRDSIFAECRQIDTRFEKRKKMLAYLADVAADVRFALRQFRRQPKFWTAVVLTLVIGISTSTAIFALVDGVLLQPLPYRDPGRLVHVMNGTWKGIFHHLSQRTGTLDLAAYNGGPEITLSTEDGPIRLAAATVSPELFAVLGATPALGRTFTAEEARPGSPAVAGSDTWRTYGTVVVSYGLWQSYFGGDPNALGRSVTVSGTAHTIIGIMPPEFDFPSRETALWLPMSIEPANNLNMWGGNAWTIVGRLRDGTALDAAQQEARALISTFGNLFPSYLRIPLERYAAGVVIRPLHEQIVGSVRTELLVLLAAIGSVLLILCVNVANLLLARGLGRDRELATRAALGAGRRRLVRQLLVENVTASIVAGLAGTLAAFALLRTLVAFLPADLPRIDEVQLDARVLFFASAISLAAGLAFGLLPAIRVTRSGATLLTRATGGVGRREGRLTAILVSMEFSLAVVLVVSAALLLQSLWNLSRVDPGFRVEGLVSARIAPLSSLDALNSELLTRLRETPGVAAAAIGTGIPFGNDAFSMGFGIEGRLGSDDNPTIADVAVAMTPEYLPTLGIPLVEGRAFDDTDRTDSVPVVLVSQSLARAYWGGESPIGARIQLPERPLLRTVVGVVGDVKWRELSGEDPRALYLPLSQHNAFSPLLRRVVVRTNADPAVIAGNLRAIVRSLESDTAVSDIRTSSARIAGSIARPRFAAYLLAGFATVALLLAAIGIYGTLSYAMNRRIPEIGVRLALGATDRDVFSLLFRHGLCLTLVGIAIGIPIALGVTRLLTSLLFGVDPTDARLLAVVAVSLLGIGLAVSYPPARKAGRVDPMVALRHE